MAALIGIAAAGHCQEPDSGLARWMGRDMAHLAPNRVTDSTGHSHLMVEGRLAARRRWGGGEDRWAVFADHSERSGPAMTDDKLRHVLGENARLWFNLKDEDLPVR